jgi:hypothetical protein
MLGAAGSFAAEKVKIVEITPTCPVVAPCEKKIMVKLSQTSYSLNIWKHIGNALNAVEFELPVSCEFYESVSVGDELLKKKFRWGSLAVKGSMGTWNLEVSGK